MFKNVRNEEKMKKNKIDYKMVAVWALILGLTSFLISGFLFCIWMNNLEITAKIDIPNIKIENFSYISEEGNQSVQIIIKNLEIQGEKK